MFCKCYEDMKEFKKSIIEFSKDYCGCCVKKEWIRRERGVREIGGRLLRIGGGDSSIWFEVVIMGVIKLEVIKRYFRNNFSWIKD